MKKRVKKISLISVAILFTVVAVFLLLPGNYHVHKALVNLLPKINQYPIFENRVVRAGNPQPWQMAQGEEAWTIPAEYVDDFKALETVAYVVIQHNEIVFEQYWEDYNPQSHSNSFSMAKSILSLLVGCAIDDGYIKSVDQPVSDFLPEWTSYDGTVLTVKHLLTMSAGVDWDEAYSSLFSKTTKAYYGNDLWALTLTERLIEKPGVKFNYQSGVSQIIAFMLQKATGKTVSDYASEKIWTPIGAEEDALWSLDHKDGMEKAYCCFNSNARDFARLGQLVLNHGRWNGVQVVDSAYITEATTAAAWLTFLPKVADAVPQPCSIYGYQFWILNYDGMTIPYFRGILGQYIFVLPQHDAVIVRLGHKRDEEYVAEQNYPKDVDLWLKAGLDILAESK